MSEQPVIRRDTLRRDDDGFELSPRLLIGLVLIFFGVLFTLDNLGWVDAGSVFDYWPLLLVFVGLGKLLWPASGAGRLVGFVLLVLGVGFLLDNLDFVEFDLGELWPLILIAVGLGIFWRAFTSGRRGDLDVARKSDDRTINAVAVLGGARRTSTAEDFRGGDLLGFMGSCEVDLRRARISDSPAVIDALAFWGGVEIKVPRDWSVTVKGIPLLGGYEDKTEPPAEDSGQRLVVKGFAIMGGVEITN